MKLNYINQTNIFFRIAGSKELNSSARILYLALLYKNNTLTWIERFTCTASELEGFSGLSESSLQRARKQLVDAGLIEYKKRRGRQPPIYSIPELNEHTLPFILNSKVKGNAKGNVNDNVKGNAKTLVKTKQTKTTTANPFDDDEQNDDLKQHPLAYYQQAFGLSARGTLTQHLQDLANYFGNEIVNYAMQLAASKGKDFSYANGILKHWYDRHVKSLDEAQQDHSSKPGNQATRKPEAVAQEQKNVTKIKEWLAKEGES